MLSYAVLPLTLTLFAGSNAAPFLSTLHVTTFLLMLLPGTSTATDSSVPCRADIPAHFAHTDCYPFVVISRWHLYTSSLSLTSCMAKFLLTVLVCHTVVLTWYCSCRFPIILLACVGVDGILAPLPSGGVNPHRLLNCNARFWVQKWTPKKCLWGKKH